MIGLTKDEAKNIMRANKWMPTEEDPDLYTSDGRSLAIKLDWNGALARAIGLPALATDGCAYVCAPPTNTPLEKRHSLSEAGLLNAIMQVQTVEQKQS